MAWGRSGFAAALCVVLLPEGAYANPPEPQSGSAPGAVYNPAFALAPGFAPGTDNPWLAGTPWTAPFAAPAYRSLSEASDLGEDLASPTFDIGGYDAMWNDTLFSEIA